MCVVKAPKIKPQQTQAAVDKPLPILRNPLLDGLDPSTGALRIGRRSLRIDRNPAQGPTAAATVRPPVSALNSLAVAPLSIGFAGG